MTNNRTGNNKYLKQLNQAMILNLIRVNNSISKAELSQITGLSATAIGAITSSLLEDGYIHETGIGESKGGRRPVLLELKPHSYYSVGVDMDVNCISIILIDTTGNIIFETSAHMPQPTEISKVMSLIEERILQILSQFKIAFDKLLGIGISVPGMVDNKTQEIIFAPNLGWQNVDISTYLSKLADIPVYVENEALASAICENWLGCCQEDDDFVCINIKSGIGAGIFTGGRLYSGASGSAGEVGHIVVDENGPRCGCGNYGCFETLASTTRIAEKARKLVRQGIASSLNDIADVDSITIDCVVEAARNGDEAARNILTEAARYMGIAISNLVNTLNPSKVVIGKEFVKYADLVMGHIKETVNCKALKFPAFRVEIKASEIGEKASALGAATIPLKILFGK